MRIARWLLALPIRFYQRFISPLKPPTCRFTPTCSNYALQALERHGVFKGSGLTIWRILRCQPFSRGGHDPVPPARDGRTISHVHEDRKANSGSCTQAPDSNNGARGSDDE